MSPDEKDPAYIWDMLDFAREATRLVEGVSWSDYVGESARRVSETTRRAHPEIEWPKIIGLRNVLAHDYGEIFQGRLHEIATDVMPGVAGKLENILPPLPVDDE